MSESRQIRIYKTNSFFLCWLISRARLVADAALPLTVTLPFTFVERLKFGEGVFDRVYRFGVPLLGWTLVLCLVGSFP